MTFGKVKGQERAAKTLSGILATGRLPAAVVFSGMDGVGKTLMAVEFARTLLCSGGPGPAAPAGAGVLRSPEGACGFCPDCLAVDQGTHSDLSLVNAQYQAALLEEEPAKQKSLRVDTIRHLRRDMEMRSLMGGWKIAVLEDAHTLEIQSANALLKSLEEPNPRTLWILVSSQRERLPATVLSRCFSVPFSPLAPDIVRRILEDQGTTPERAARAAELCEGSASRALELAESDYPESLTAGIMAPFAAAEKLPREAYLARTQVESALFALGQDLRQRHLEGGLPFSRAEKALREIVRLRRALRSNADPKAVLTLACLAAEEAAPPQ